MSLVCSVLSNDGRSRAGIVVCIRITFVHLLFSWVSLCAFQVALFAAAAIGHRCLHLFFVVFVLSAIFFVCTFAQQSLPIWRSPAAAVWRHLKLLDSEAKLRLYLFAVSCLSSVSPSLHRLSFPITVCLFASVCFSICILHFCIKAPNCPLTVLFPFVRSFVCSDAADE